MRTIIRHAVVDWWDAYSDGRDVTASTRDKGLPSVSSGFLVQNNKAGVRLAQIAHLNESGSVSYKNGMFVPRGMVAKVRITSVSIHRPFKART